MLHDLTGVRFGKLLVVIRKPNNAGGSAMWECLCDCGQVRINAGTSLRAGRHKSCSCASPLFTTERVSTHRMTKTRTYGIWAGMRFRCQDMNGRSAHLYAAKGIRVCGRWQSFENFLADMGECPPGLSIERRDNSLGYSPENCRWATRKEQGNNTAANHWVEFAGERHTVAQWAERIGIKANTLTYRLRRGWPTEKAMRP